MWSGGLRAHQGGTKELKEYLEMIMKKIDPVTYRKEEPVPVDDTGEPAESEKIDEKDQEKKGVSSILNLKKGLLIVSLASLVFLPGCSGSETINTGLLSLIALPSIIPQISKVEPSQVP